MHYVNLAAASDTLAYAISEENNADLLGDRSDILATPNEWHYLNHCVHEREQFTAGISYALGMMLDPDTAAIIEQAARERAEEDA